MTLQREGPAIRFEKCLTGNLMEMPLLSSDLCKRRSLLATLLLVDELNAADFVVEKPLWDYSLPRR